MVGAESIPPAVFASAERAALLNASRHGGKADAAAVAGRVLAELPELRDRPQVASEAAREAVRSVNSMSLEEQTTLLAEKYPEEKGRPVKEGRVGLPPLQNATKGKAAFRLPPEPSGYMTVGHAMAFTINYLYREMYDGELWLRFEDTNPRKVAPAYYDSFRRGLAWLGIKCDHEKSVSADLEAIYDKGRQLVEAGSAYACSCDAARMKKLRFAGEECEHRGNTVQENLSVWEGLLSKKYGEGEYVIRFRGEMQSPNFELRDSNLFRVIEHPHPLTGTKYTLWPTYDIANAVEDEMCGITHVLRSSEFRAELQVRLRAALGLRQPEVIQFSRFNFKGTPVSKRLLRPLVEQKFVTGWDDPRMPTVDGVRRRGIVPQAIREFTLQVGYTKSEHEYDWSLLLSTNRKLLDPLSKRIFFVPDPVKLTVAGAPKRMVSVPFHPTEILGERSFDTDGVFYVPRRDVETLKPGEVFRLMDLYNVRFEASGEAAQSTYSGDELVSGSRKLQWVTNDSVPVKVMVPGVLFDERGEFDPASMKEVTGKAEPSFRLLKVGDIVQFPRFGFCRVDSEGSCICAG